MERRQAGKWASRQAGKADRKKGKKICKTAAQQDRRKAGQQAGQTDTKKLIIWWTRVNLFILRTADSIK